MECYIDNEDSGQMQSAWVSIWNTVRESSWRSQFRYTFQLAVTFARMTLYNLSVRSCYSQISDADLDATISACFSHLLFLYGLYNYSPHYIESFKCSLGSCMHACMLIKPKVSDIAFYPLPNILETWIKLSRVLGKKRKRKSPRETHFSTNSILYS